MKKTLLIFIIVAFFLDYSFLPMLQMDISFGANFSLLVLVVVFLKRQYVESFWWAVLGGVLLDYVSSVPLGMFVFSFLLVGFGLEFFQKKLQTKAPNSFSLLFLFISSFVVVETSCFIVQQVAHFLGIISYTVVFEFESIRQLLFLKVTLSFLGIFLFTIVDKIEWFAGEKSLKLKIDS
ncbi:MAG: rod shape-determining protein MreD [Patescibacteria group bacterium]|nr:rod shape-determining protein MreD [Patescibacteria group bacterium]